MIHFLQFKRSNEFMNDPFNFEENSLYVELFLVIDKKVYNKLGNDMREVHRYCIDFVNHVHGVWVYLILIIIHMNSKIYSLISLPLL